MTHSVYVIDDDSSVRRALGRLLRIVGYRVKLCASAKEFLAIPEIMRPACLLVDVRMPGETGFDLQATLRAEGRDLPIVFITGHGDATMAARAVASGAVAFLNKPVDQTAVLDAIELGLERDRQTLQQEAKAQATKS